MNAARGKYLAFVDSDDWFYSLTALEELYERAEQFSLDLLRHRLICFNNATGTFFHRPWDNYAKFLPKGFNATAFPPEACTPFFWRIPVTAPGAFYRRAFIEKNKEDLCASIIEDHEKAFCSQLANVKQYAKGPEDVLYEGLKLHFDFFMKDPIHSKFVIQMISYTLDVSPRMPVERPKNRYIHGMLEQLLQQEAKRGHIPADAIGDVVRLISGVATEIMMSAYLDQHVCPRHSKSALYTPEVIARLVQIVLLGIKEYYKERK